MTPFTDSELLEIGREAAQAAWRDGMIVYRPDGSVVEIPLVADPEVFPRAMLDALAEESRSILSGAVKLARALLSRGDPRDLEALLGPFAGIEAEAMARLFEEAPCPAVVARVDYLTPTSGHERPRALELNATIPAMPAYADLAAHAWIRAAAKARGLPRRKAEALVAEAGSNAENLRRALDAFYRERGGTRARPSIAIVARQGDAQRGELRYLAQHFRNMGHDAIDTVPEECEPERWDVLYRHVWAHRTPPDSPFARALREPGRYVLANPVNGLLEAKSLFARLSECGEDEDLTRLAGLSPSELEAARRLPWTRLLDPSLVPRLVEDRDRWVLKRSWDYGGKSVHLGRELTHEAWTRVVEDAARDLRGGGFVVQERVFATPRPATRMTPGGAERTHLYRDVSTYAGLGPRPPSGSVVRAAASPIVNILGGGGLAPVIPGEVLEALSERA